LTTVQHTLYIHIVYMPFIGQLMGFGQHSDIRKMSVLFDR